MSKRKEDGLYRRGDSPYVWASYTNAGGRRVRCSTGTTDWQEAVAILAKWRLEAHRERHWGTEPTRTFDELMVRYLDETQDLKRSAERDVAITRQLKKHFSGKVLNELGGEDVQAYIQWRRHARGKPGREKQTVGRLQSAGTIKPKEEETKKKPVAYATIRRELSLLSSAINYAIVRWDWNIPNPVEKRKPPQGEDRIRWLKAAEAERLIAAARREPRAPHLADFIILGLHTGCRSQEMLGLEWDRVDMEQRLVYLPASKNKSGRNVSVPLNDTAYAVLRRLKRFREEHCPKSKTPWVFCSKRGGRVAAVKRSFKTACRRAGITDFRPHDLRHTCAAWLVQAGVPLMQVRDLLRHTSYQVTEKYAHLSPSHVRDAVDVLNAKHASSEPREAAQVPEREAKNTIPSRSGHVRPRLRVIRGGKHEEIAGKTGS
ncbi:MAG: site-specific integrase [Gammaproteobacteria bacterium]